MEIITADDSCVQKAANAIKKGKTIVFPTDTVYGLLADATNKKAVAKNFKIKKRDTSKSFPIFVKDIAMAKELTEIDKKQENFLKKSWPGKVTAVLKRKHKSKNQKIRVYGIAGDTIALRIPNHNLILKMLKLVNKPLIGTSANISGLPASGKIEEIKKQFKGRKFQPDLIFDAGEFGLSESKPSRIVDLTGKKQKILRK